MEIKVKKVFNISYQSYNDNLFMGYYGKQYIVDPIDSNNIKTFITQILTTNNTISNTNRYYIGAWGFSPIQKDHDLGSFSRKVDVVEYFRILDRLALSYKMM